MSPVDIAVIVFVVASCAVIFAYAAKDFRDLAARERAVAERYWRERDEWTAYCLECAKRGVRPDVRREPPRGFYPPPRPRVRS